MYRKKDGTVIKTVILFFNICSVGLSLSYIVIRGDIVQFKYKAGKIIFKLRSNFFSLIISGTKITNSVVGSLLKRKNEGTRKIPAKKITVNVKETLLTNAFIN